MATGVLPIFLGRATRVVEFATEGTKEYIAGLQLGTVTDTQDITGTILKTSPVSVTTESLNQVLPDLTGNISQIPPMYSAIKIQGQKLYQLARKGKVIDRPPRPITIHSLTLEQETTPNTYILKIACSKGTYIRTLCHDIGERLGCGGTMYSLERTKAAGYTLAQSHPLEEILNHPHPTDLLLPIDSYFTHPKLTVLPWQEAKIRNGSSCTLHPDQISDYPEGDYRIYGEKGDFLALSHLQQQKLTTIKSFFEVDHQ